MSEETGTSCFVAMWFGSDDDDSKAQMDQLYDVVIEPAVRANNLSAYHVGRDLSADRLDTTILKHIDQSSVVVVDLTHDPETGFRGSVVFEAGYAYKSKPVVWMCRADLADKTFFDIQPLRQIRWHPNRLMEAKNELSAVIGERLRVYQKDKVARFISSIGPVSPRARSVAEQLDEETFKLFQRLCSIAVVCEDAVVVHEDGHEFGTGVVEKLNYDRMVCTLKGTDAGSSLARFGLGPASLSRLAEYGLVVTEIEITRDYLPSGFISDTKRAFFRLRYKDVPWSLIYTGQSELTRFFRIRGVGFSTAGNELYPFVDIIGVPEYTDALIDFFSHEGLIMTEDGIDAQDQY